MMASHTGLATAVRHALGWLVVGNAVGLYLSLLLLVPAAQIGPLTYGRWIPVHLNVQLYGWTSLPLLAWLMEIYEVDRSRAAPWAAASVWAWTTALAIGIWQWLSGLTSGKIFLDWSGGALWALVAAVSLAWCLLAAAWSDRESSWPPLRRWLSLGGLLMLGSVPLTLAYAASPSVYPPIDVTTGGPTGSSLLGSTLAVIALMLGLPRMLGFHRRASNGTWIWAYLALCWLVFYLTESSGGTHHDWSQLAAMALLLPWGWWLPHDWYQFDWPGATRVWRLALLVWWVLLVLSGVTMYLPGVLDRMKFTDGLVAHSHLAMAGFTSSFCALLIVTLQGRPLGGRTSVMAWLAATLLMVATLAILGWMEGGSVTWMTLRPPWRELGLAIRTLCGVVLLAVSLRWLIERRTS